MTTLMEMQLRFHEQQAELDAIWMARAFGLPISAKGTARTQRTTRHVADPPRRPWYQVAAWGSRELLYRGPSRAAAEAAQARHPRSTLVGSEWGG